VNYLEVNYSDLEVNYLEVNYLEANYRGELLFRGEFFGERSLDISSLGVPIWMCWTLVLRMRQHSRFRSRIKIKPLDSKPCNKSKMASVSLREKSSISRCDVLEIQSISAVGVGCAE
jgi:hypothetical protein